MTAEATLEEIEPLESARCKKGFLNHVAGEPCFGVRIFGARIPDLEVIRKRVKKDCRLALGPYETLESNAGW